MFLLAGRILDRYGTADIAARARPAAADAVARARCSLPGCWRWSGLPPFGLFIVASSLMFRAGFANGHRWLHGASVLLLLRVAFVGLLSHLNRMLVRRAAGRGAIGERGAGASRRWRACALALVVLGLVAARAASRRCSTASWRSPGHEGPGRRRARPRAPAAGRLHETPRSCASASCTAGSSRATRASLAAGRLRADLGARAAGCMVATDRRRDAGRFEVHYLFAHRPRELVRARACSRSARRPPRSPRWPRSITRPRSSSARSTTSSASRPRAIRIRARSSATPSGRPTTSRCERTPCRARVRRRRAALPVPPRWRARASTRSRSGRSTPGVIEPGHFRFSVVGETIIDMKIAPLLHPQGHREALRGARARRGRGAGRARLGRHHRRPRARLLPGARSGGGRDGAGARPLLRVVLLEMERLYNHVADFGMIANDTGFAVAHSHCFRIRERLLRLNKRLTGNRLLRGGDRAGRRGPRPARRISDLRRARWTRPLARLRRDRGAILRNTLVMDRLEGTGQLTTPDRARPRRAGLRGAGLRDRRRRAPRPSVRGLRRAGVCGCPVLRVAATSRRARMVRIEEARESVRLIRRGRDRAARPARSRSPLGPAAGLRARLRRSWKAGGARSCTG